MKTIQKPVAWMLIAAAVSFFYASGSVLADDTEIFLAGADPDEDGVVFPNIMFIIDTSGSMGTIIKAQDPYKASTTYAGTCDSNYIYVTTTNNEPDCTASNPTRFQRSNLNCVSAISEFNGGRLYEDKILAWRDDIDRWNTLPSGEFDRPVDCKNDQSTKKKDGKEPDGLALDDGLFMRDGNNGPYSNKKKNQPGFSTRYYLWDGNVQNYGQSASVDKSRIDTVKQVVDNMLDGLQEVNVGLMRFNTNSGGPVLVPIESIDINRDLMKTTVGNLTDNGNTPLSETFYEFGQYMYGKNVVYGDGYEYESVAESRINGNINSKKYKSPATVQCQKNYVIYLSDGEPTSDTGAENAIETLIGKNCVNDHGSNNGKCLDELAEYYANTPVVDDGNGNGEGIKTYTIGFNIDLQLLKDTAAKGKGAYYTADDTAQLTATLTKITIDILKDASTFTAPAVPVNAFNRTQTLSTVYTSVFEPASSIHWPGNLKRYSFTDGQFVGKDDQPIVDESGYFSKEAWDFWSTVRDGANIQNGGAANNLPSYVSRKLYTDLSGDELLVAGNKIDETNNALSADTFGATAGTTTINGITDTWSDIMINWLNGRDYKDADDDDDVTDTRHQMGDPLHVRPVPIVYGGTEANPDIVLYLTTNDGQLHAVNAETGVELWSYIPGSVLDRMFTLFVDEVSVDKGYILDGQPTVYVLNDDGLPGFNGPDEHVILVMSMRRGGSSYFALDITDKNNPEKLWEIDSDSNGDFPEMGQSWSVPQMGLVRMDPDYSLDPTPVAIFGGGYDVSQDTNVYSTDSAGNAIYMVNLLTGEKIWSAGNNSANHDLVLDMQHSIPAPPLVVDTNGDRLLDRLYVGDMGGRIWRMDFFNGNGASNFAGGGILATLGAADISGTPDKADLRRFYNQVDLVEDVYGETRYFSVNIGSGYRAHPLDRDIQEEFYAVRDFRPYTKLQSTDSAYSTSNQVTRDDLIDISSSDTNTVSPGSAGWRLDMGINAGEKVLGKSLTINGITYFTSFSPDKAASSCNAQPGTNFLYSVNLAWGRPVLNLDVFGENEDYELADFAEDTNIPSIASPVFLMTTGTVITDPDDGSTRIQTKSKICTSLVCNDDEIILPPTRTFWTEEGM